MNRWPHQTVGVCEVLEAIRCGQRKILLTTPTGGGKTLMASDLIRHYLDQGKKVGMYSNRKMLVDQLSEMLLAQGHEHGIRAAGYADTRDLDLQVSSIQTEGSRVLRKRQWQLHEAELVIVDEAHLQKEKTAQKILDEHYEQGAVYVGLTATPLGLAGLYDHLIIAGTTSELRQCGALVPCRHYGPDEPDLRHIRNIQVGDDLTHEQNRKAMMVPGIFGRVLDWWKKLNPEGKPTILFAPGVPESVWFAQQFFKEGISAASIDGDDIWIDGHFYKSDRERRRDLLEQSKSGELKVLCNRFVLREGIDAPWLAHGIFATVFGSLQSYLQSGGRLLRASPGLGHVVIQDHGGNWYRHGSLNADRQWQLGDTSRILCGLREERFRGKTEKEPSRCPRCGLILSSLSCLCGFQIEPGRKSRPVVQKDGSYQFLEGDIYKPRRICQRRDVQRMWQKMYHRAFRSRNRMTFRQAEALFAYENHWQWPPRSLKLMPLQEGPDWFRPVRDVPKERLR